MNKPVYIQDLDSMFEAILDWIDENPTSVVYFDAILSQSKFLTRYVERAILRGQSQISKQLTK